MPYFHELAHEDRAAMGAAGWTWAEIARAYRQPDWCDYPDAMRGGLGCWSLIRGSIRSVRDCFGCALCNAVVVTGLMEDFEN